MRLHNESTGTNEPRTKQALINGSLSAHPACVLPWLSSDTISHRRGLNIRHKLVRGEREEPFLGLTLTNLLVHHHAIRIRWSTIAMLSGLPCHSTPPVCCCSYFLDFNKSIGGISDSVLLVFLGGGLELSYLHFCFLLEGSVGNARCIV